MKKLKNVFSWLTTSATRRFWIPRIGILVMILGILLQVKFGFPVALFLIIESFGFTIFVGTFLIIESQK
jgi:hypothetical protein